MYKRSTQSEEPIRESGTRDVYKTGREASLLILSRKCCGCDNHQPAVLLSPLLVLTEESLSIGIILNRNIASLCNNAFIVLSAAL